MDNKSIHGNGAFLNAIRKINDGVVVGVFVALTVSILLQVTFRYVFQSPLRWTEEAARYLLIWLVLLGSAVAMRTHSHLQIDVLSSSLPPTARRFSDTIINLLVIIFLVIMTFQGMRATAITMAQTSPAMKISMGVVYAALPVGGVLMIMEITISFIHMIKEGFDSM